MGEQALVGEGDLADIARLVAHGTGIHIEVSDIKADLKKYDAVLVTDATDPHGTFDAIKNKVECQRLLTLKLLHISRVE